MTGGKFFTITFSILIPALIYTTGLPRSDDYRGKARAWYNLGVVYLRQGRITEAKECFLTAIPDKSGSYRREPMVSYGVALEKEGNHKGAEFVFREVLKINPEIGEVHFNLATVLVKSGEDLQEAIKEYEESARLDYRKSSSFNNIGGLLVKLGRNQEAVKAFSQAVAIDPENQKAKRNLQVALLKMQPGG